jgi:hypothetical protein
MRLIDADTPITAQIYDEEHEEFVEKRMTIADYIDAYTVEGCPQIVEQKRGRWIDADALLAKCIERQKNRPGYYERGWSDNFLNDALEPSTEWWCVEQMIEDAPTVEPKLEWISVKDRLPEPHEKNDHEADVMLYVPKREGVRQHGIYLGLLRKEPWPPDDGSGNFWGVQCPGSDWTVWGWSHFEEPSVTHWMPLPEPPKEEGGETDG